MPEIKKRKPSILAYERVLNVGEQKSFDLLNSDSANNGVWKNELNTTMSINTLKGLMFGEDWPFICCDRIASKIAAQPIMVMKKTLNARGQKVTEVVEDTAVQAMLENPNEYQTYYQWMYSLVMDLMCTGNAVNWVAFTSKQIIHIPIENIQIDSETGVTGGIKCYRVVMGNSEDFPMVKSSVSIPPNQICHVRRPNPSSMIWGLSPFIAGRKSVLFNKHSTEYLNNYYVKGAQPSMILEMDAGANENNVLRLLRSFEASHTGRSNQRRNMILPKGVTAKDASHKLADQQLKEYLELNRETIINLLQIPKHELSLAGSGSLGSEEYKTALRNFWNGPIKGSMKMIAQSLTKTLKPLLPDDYFLEFDLSDVEVLQADKTSRADLATKMLSTHSVNEIRAELYEIDPILGGEKLQVPPSQGFQGFSQVQSQTPAANDAVLGDVSADVITTPTQSLNGAQVSSLIEIVTQVKAGLLDFDSAVSIIMVAYALDEPTARSILGQGAIPEAVTSTKSVDSVDDIRKRNIERLDMVLKSNDGWWSKREAIMQESTDKHAEKLAEVVTNLFADQAVSAIEIVQSMIKKKSLVTKADELSKAEFKRRLRKALGSFESQYVEDYANALATQMDMGYDSSLILPFNLPNEGQIAALKAKNADGRRQILDDRGLQSFQYMSKTTTEQVMASITDGIEKQQTVDEMVRGLKEMFTNPDEIGGRLERIVRTETLTAASIGQSQAMNDAGSVIPGLKKSWVNAGDDRVRGKKASDGADHVSLQGVILDFDQPFTDPRSGTKMMYPRDTNGEAGDIINCRCSLIYMPPENAAALGFENLNTEENPA
ncbi:Bacteriophage/Gene transfer agent portal protein [uncultured Caudovirales phage]|uniref:Bacteriophage/Gene transfer agent portal protein n=1 Tax=uncultured Caudovirales phage TaxID=2100421 RepID=A0A6J5PGJ5_9CAUD|nr:Bacteriophage/Gene transfer agent portal protein [uncultured Caudovirales phage]